MSQPQRVDLHDLESDLAGFLHRVEQGASYLVMSHDRVLAELNPPLKPGQSYRQPGALRGKIWMAPDFDLLPPNVLAAMEGSEE